MQPRQYYCGQRKFRKVSSSWHTLVGSAKWEVKEVKFKVGDNFGDGFRPTGSIGSKFRSMLGIDWEKSLAHYLHSLTYYSLPNSLEKPAIIKTSQTMFSTVNRLHTRAMIIHRSVMFYFQLAEKMSSKVGRNKTCK